MLVYNKYNVSYLVLRLFPGRGNRTSFPGSSPAGDGRLLLPHPGAPNSTVILLWKDERRVSVSGFIDSQMLHKLIANKCEFCKNRAANLS